jgi:hypothetical protein
VRAKEHAGSAVGISVNPHQGPDEVGPEPALGQLQPLAAPCNRVVVGNSSLFDHAQRLAPGLVPVGNECGAFLLGLDRKRCVVLGQVMRLQPRIGGFDSPDPGEPQILRQPACSVPNIRSERPRASGE